MRNRTTLRRVLMLAVAFAAAVAVYGLTSPTEAQAADGARGRSRVGYRSGARRVASRYRYARPSSHHGSHHGNFHFDRVYHQEGIHYTPWQGLHSYGHYDLVPSYGHSYYGHGGHHRSGIHFSFGF